MATKELTEEEVQKYLHDIQIQYLYWDDVLESILKNLKNSPRDIRWTLMSAFLYGRIRGQQMEREKKKKKNVGTDALDK